MSAQLETSVPPLSLGIVLYPGYTLLDLAGPNRPWVCTAKLTCSGSR